MSSLRDEELKRWITEPNVSVTLTRKISDPVTDVTMTQEKQVDGTWKNSFKATYGVFGPLQVEGIEFLTQYASRLGDA